MSLILRIGFLGVAQMKTHLCLVSEISLASLLTVASDFRSAEPWAWSAGKDLTCERFVDLTALEKANTWQFDFRRALETYLCWGGAHPHVPALPPTTKPHRRNFKQFQNQKGRPLRLSLRTEVRGKIQKKDWSSWSVQKPQSLHLCVQHTDKHLSQRC